MPINDTQRATLLSALDMYRGDDYERASSAFRGLNPEQMKQEYGMSGQSCQSILDGYKERVDRVNDCRKLIESL